MAKWTFEPGHTAAEFCARHMMVTCVRGHFKNIHGTLEFDPQDPQASAVNVKIEARGIWSGEAERDDHLRSADFLDADNYPEIAFTGKAVKVIGAHDYSVECEIPGNLGNTLVGGRRGQRTQNPRWLCGQHKDQPP